jgi:hypothetical protein
MSLLVSSIKLSLVAVNLGGSCGGVLGDMVEFVSGRKLVRSGLSFRYCTIDGGRTPSRNEARMVKMATKKTTSTNLFVVRERATIALAYVDMGGEGTWGAVCFCWFLAERGGFTVLS